MRTGSLLLVLQPDVNEQPPQSHWLTVRPATRSCVQHEPNQKGNVLFVCATTDHTHFVSVAVVPSFGRKVCFTLCVSSNSIFPTATTGFVIIFSLPNTLHLSVTMTMTMTLTIGLAVPCTHGKVCKWDTVMDNVRVAHIALRKNETLRRGCAVACWNFKRKQ